VSGFLSSHSRTPGNDPLANSFDTGGNAISAVPLCLNLHQTSKILDILSEVLHIQFMRSGIRGLVIEIRYS
jgi:hypothetical protein